LCNVIAQPRFLTLPNAMKQMQNFAKAVEAKKHRPDDLTVQAWEELNYDLKHYCKEFGVVTDFVFHEPIVEADHSVAPINKSAPSLAPPSKSPPQPTTEAPIVVVPQDNAPAGPTPERDAPQQPLTKSPNTPPPNKKPRLETNPPRPVLEFAPEPKKVDMDCSAHSDSSLSDEEEENGEEENEAAESEDEESEDEEIEDEEIEDEESEDEENDEEDESKRKIGERERFVMSKLPWSTKHRFGQIGFAPWGKNYYPALVVNPFMVSPGDAPRNAWMKAFEKSEQTGKPMKQFLVRWYGPSSDEPFYSNIPQIKFVPYYRATKTMLNFAKSAERKTKRSAADKQLLGALDEMNEDLQEYCDNDHAQVDSYAYDETPVVPPDFGPSEQTQGKNAETFNKAATPTTPPPETPRVQNEKVTDYCDSDHAQVDSYAHGQIPVALPDFGPLEQTEDKNAETFNKAATPTMSPPETPRVHNDKVTEREETKADVPSEATEKLDLTDLATGESETINRSPKDQPAADMHVERDNYQNSDETLVGKEGAADSQSIALEEAATVSIVATSQETLHKSSSERSVPPLPIESLDEPDQSTTKFVPRAVDSPSGEEESKAVQEQEISQEMSTPTPSSQCLKLKPVFFSPSNLSIPKTAAAQNAKSPVVSTEDTLNQTDVTADKSSDSFPRDTSTEQIAVEDMEVDQTDTAVVTPDKEPRSDVEIEDVEIGDSEGSLDSRSGVEMEDSEGSLDSRSTTTEEESALSLLDTNSDTQLSKCVQLCLEEASMRAATPTRKKAMKSNPKSVSSLDSDRAVPALSSEKLEKSIEHGGSAHRIDHVHSETVEQGNREHNNSENLGERNSKIPVMSKLPTTIASKFGEIGFARWGKTFWPAVIENPFEVDEEIAARRKWMHDFQMREAKSKPLDKFPLLVRWYGGQDTYNVVAQSKFVPFHEATKQMLNFAKAAENKLKAVETLTAAEAERICAMTEMVGDFNRCTGKNDNQNCEYGKGESETHVSEETKADSESARSGDSKKQVEDSSVSEDAFRRISSGEFREHLGTFCGAMEKLALELAVEDSHSITDCSSSPYLYCSDFLQL